MRVDYFELSDQRRVWLSPPVHIFVRIRHGYWVAVEPSLGLDIVLPLPCDGYTDEDVEKVVLDELRFLWEEYAEEEDSNLSPEARRLKKKLLQAGTAVRMPTLTGDHWNERQRQALGSAPDVPGMGNRLGG